MKRFAASALTAIVVSPIFVTQTGRTARGLLARSAAAIVARRVTVIAEFATLHDSITADRCGTGYLNGLKVGKTADLEAHPKKKDA